MDSPLDLKFKRLMRTYFPGKKEKINPKYITKMSQPYLFKQIKLQKGYSKKKISKKKFSESPNILFIKLKILNWHQPIFYKIKHFISLIRINSALIH